MAKTLQLTKTEFPEVFEKLNRLYGPIKKNKDDKQSFRDFCSKLLSEICNSKLPQQDSESQEQNSEEK